MGGRGGSLCLLVLIALTATGQPVDYFIQIEPHHNCSSLVSGPSENRWCSVTVEDEPECAADARDRPKCMCLEDQRNTSSTRIEVCEWPQEVGNGSKLGFCGPALASINNYCVQLVNASTINTTSGVCMETLNNAALKATIKGLEAHRKEFLAVLDRTIVGVYLESRSQRDKCMRSYEQWLCATMLPLYMDTGTKKPSSCTCTTSGPGNTSLTRVKPCLNVCHRVLQQCPYYIPSKFQHSNSSPEGESAHFEIVYGGYPAFDCPRKDILKKQLSNNASYFSTECGCIGAAPIFRSLLSVVCVCVSLALFVGNLL